MKAKDTPPMSNKIAQDATRTYSVYATPGVDSQVFYLQLCNVLAHVENLLSLSRAERSRWTDQPCERHVRLVERPLVRVTTYNVD